MYTRELERIVRSFVAMHLDAAYIRHYIGETYQIDEKTISLIMERAGVSTGTRPKAGGPLAKAPPEPRRNRF